MHWMLLLESFQSLGTVKLVPEVRKMTFGGLAQEQVSIPPTVPVHPDSEKPAAEQASVQLPETPQLDSYRLDRLPRTLLSQSELPSPSRWQSRLRSRSTLQ